MGLSSSYIPIITSLGYAYVVSTFRGYWGSTGIRLSFMSDGWGPLHDGLDVANWISSRPWYNGKMRMVGGSALGFSQYFLGRYGISANPYFSGCCRHKPL
ncbi:MAG: CocE/NonD family hydrolase [candidate division WOR-3 bacterium]